MTDYDNRVLRTASAVVSMFADIPQDKVEDRVISYFIVNNSVTSLNFAKDVGDLIRRHHIRHLEKVA